MPWAKLDDNFSDHPAVLEAWQESPGSVGLYTLILSRMARLWPDRQGMSYDEIEEMACGYVPGLDVLERVGLIRQNAEGWAPVEQPGVFGGFTTRRPDLPSNLRTAVLARDGLICGICRKAIESERELHIDHIFPVAKGGPTRLENLQPAHARCNMSKGARV